VSDAEAAERGRASATNLLTHHLPTGVERRHTRRYGLKVPLIFCPMPSPLTDGHPAKSINISSRGVYFLTSHPVSVGLPVQILLRMPKRIAGALPAERIFTGRVSRVELADTPNGSSGVGVEFVYWENAQQAVQPARSKQACRVM
jgi:hypothetical protein